ncbi:MAG: thiamine diphosphokinase [Bacteroidetes bacterium RBG_13_42_15]|nr:MAG: thiamine diphosphokinase [Bacteroidetes bacterium RBG_13_42_15]
MKNTKLPDTVVLADGAFPEHEIPLECLRKASRIICCDGAAGSLVKFGLTPLAIVGDCDSLEPAIQKKYSDRIFKDTDQETNDLTKAVKWCRAAGYTELVITGATGKREDHTIGNISLLAEYIKTVKVIMVTDTGIFYPFTESCRVPSVKGQQVSLFAIDPETEITSSGLKYPLINRKLRNWWEATLNEATGDHFELKFEEGKVIVFMEF